MRAASTISRGIVLKKLVNRKTENGISSPT